MERRRFIGGMGAAGAGLMSSACLSQIGSAAGRGSRRKPLNFVFILVDDMGWSDLSCYGSSYHESPNIDKLARQGMRFTDAYAACPVCSPTRASILSGKYPAHVNVTDFIPGHWRPWAKLIVPKFNQSLPLDELTIAEALKEAGYVATSIGKWHLGRPGPTGHGFVQIPGRNRRDKDKMVGSFTEQAMRFIETNKDRPFFLFLSHHTVHIPLEAQDETIAKYKAKLKPEHVQRNPVYAAMIEDLDNSTARIMKQLGDLGLADNTVVIFTSDNGGLIKTYTGKGEVVTSNAPLRSEKGTLYEGGTRVPLIVRWPGVVKPGNKCTVPVSSVDFYPTLLDMAGAKGDPKHKLDGVSLVPLLKQKRGVIRDAIYWHYPHYHHTPPCGSVRKGDYKLIEFYEDGKLELYNLKDDIGEKSNLADKIPQKAAELRRTLDDWRKSVNATMPTPNPDYDPARAHEWGRRRKRQVKKAAKSK